MSDPTDPTPRRYAVAFLTDQWEWEADVATDQLDLAKAAARKALEDLVRDEQPALACVTLLEDGVKVGVWDWVEGQAHWSPL